MRFAMERPVEVRFPGAREAPPAQGRTVNISSGGVLFRTDQVIGVGRKIDMVVRMSRPGSEVVNVDLYLRGVIVRSGRGWAAAQVRKYRLVPIAPPGIPPGRDSGSGKNVGL